jgi:hypothetical protein
MVAWGLLQISLTGLLHFYMAPLTPFGIFQTPLLSEVLLSFSSKDEFFGAIDANQYFVLK